MSKVRIHQLAKELGIEPKEFIARLEKIGIRGKKIQNSLDEEEVAKIRGVLSAAESPQVVVGEEKVVVDRMVRDEDLNSGEIQAHEKIVERRVRANVIRRRTSRTEVVTQPDTENQKGLESDPHSEAKLPPVTTPLEETPSLISAKEKSLAQEFEAKEVVEVLSTQEIEEKVEPHEKIPVKETIESPRTAKILGRIDLKRGIPTPTAKEVPVQIPKVEVKTQEPVSDPAPIKAERIPKKQDVVDEKGPVEQQEKPSSKGVRHKKRVVKKEAALETREREYRSGRFPRKKKALPGRDQKKTEITVPKASKRVIKISEVISVGDLAKAMGIKAGEVIKKLMTLGMMATINQMLDMDTATLVGAEFEYQVENATVNMEIAIEDEHEVEEDDLALETRPPVVTIMGHVDHGKTSLLDAVRSTNVTDQEAGGITQHIGAYHVEVNGKMVTFLDTPGHEAFTAMRARGARVTDIVVLVVAADDGVMPQTVEAINHARAAKVPIVVAINKIDMPDANLERVKRGLGEHGLLSEDWGGDTIFVPVSARTKEGVPQLLEMLLLQAEILELKANPKKLAKGAVVEAKLDRGRGPVATVLVQEGTLRVGDPVVCGVLNGKVRAIIDDRGQKVEEALPSLPVEILGFQGVPQSCESFLALSDETKARQIAEHRYSKQREEDLAKSSKVSLEEFYEQIKTGEVKELRIVLKGDVHGSVEALTDALSRLSTDDVRLAVIHGSVGGVTESDVLLAAASNAVIIGFNVRPEVKAGNLAGQEGVEVRLYTVIYEAINELKAAMEGLLEPTFREQTQGQVQIREVFNISGAGSVAGCYVSDGKILRSSLVRLLRDQIVVYEGKLASLRRFKDDVREVSVGYECGLSIEGFQDIKVGDVVEAYEQVAVPRRLASARSSSEASQVSAPDNR